MSNRAVFVPILPQECAWWVRPDGTDEHTTLIGHFLSAPHRFGAEIGPDYEMDISLVDRIVPQLGDVIGVTPDGRVAHWSAEAYDLLMWPAARA